MLLLKAIIYCFTWFCIFGVWPRLSFLVRFLYMMQAEFTHMATFSWEISWDWNIPSGFSPHRNFFHVVINHLGVSYNRQLGYKNTSRSFLAEVTKIQAKSLAWEQILSYFCCRLLFKAIYKVNLGSREREKHYLMKEEANKVWPFNSITSRVTYCLKLQVSISNFNLQQLCSFLFQFCSMCFNQCIHYYIFNAYIISLLANRYSLKLTSVSIQ